MPGTQSLSLVIPVRDGAATLEQCLAAVSRSTVTSFERIVVDDGSTDSSGEIALRFGATVIRTARRGAAHARNCGARAASGDILLFCDADVCVHPDVVARVSAAFARDPGLGAVFGTYDDAPAAPGVVSQFRNLLHCYVHRTAHRHAVTFWTGCGALRRQILLAHGGFNENSVLEDIELGYRLTAGGVRIEVDPAIEVTHLKRWTFASMIRTDVFLRGAPWTELILRHRRLVNDLNLKWSQRFSVALALVTPALAVASFWRRPLWGAVAISVAALIALNLRFYRFLAARRGLRFAAAAVPLHLLHHFCSGIAFAIGVWQFATNRSLTVAAQRGPPALPD